MNGWFVLWAVFGLYHAIAAYGGSTRAAFFAMAFFFLAGHALGCGRRR